MKKKGTFRFGLKIKSKMKHVDYTIIVHETDYTVYATSPVHADDDDADCMASMAEFITRANYGLRCGNWEMDYNDGEIRYKVYVDVENIELPASIVKHSIYCAASMFERYGDGIIGVIYGGESPKAAIKKSEDEPDTTEIARLLDELGIDIESESAESAAAKLAEYFGADSDEEDDE